MAASDSKAGGAAPHGHLVLPAVRVREALAFAAGAVAAVLVLLFSSSALAPTPVPNIVSIPTTSSSHASAATPSSPSPSAAVGKGPRTFYDDPSLSYSVHDRVTGWDAKRAAWLRTRGLDPNSAAVTTRVVMVTGSQPEPCKGPGGDHALLRFLKNKLDYCRLHGVELLYNTAHLEPSMVAYWAKIPAVRAAMLAHPEAEWVWWVDADAVFTDMDFSLPLGLYASHDLVVYGWEGEVYEERSWVGLNAGVFLLRNCQWAMDLMDAWARMGPGWPEYKAWGKKMREELEGKPDEESDDQSALVYLLAKEPARWGNRTYLEREYYFQGYWAEIVGRLDGVAARYEAVERRGANRALRRRHAEREHLLYAAARDEAVKRGGVPGPAGGGQKGWRRPFVTHFTGCQPCGGAPDRKYTARRCAEGIRRALAFADDQVLRSYGFRHAAPLSDSVAPLPFDYPAAR
ncbi:putative glycosyltransferase 6 [Dichanthelium oligosanthes]|uniref:Putative glycosyltransferase 6 n=1 Tax=Dichanthelium oligosanthes TaxID=888268 RepID=A0A1E5V250_9POAL|nr:putative glycosyltransferase 6 [Dichanthelium oligosanthes]